MSTTDTTQTKKRFLVTGMAEYYNYVEAETPEQAIEISKKLKDWRRTMCLPFQDYKAVEEENKAVEETP